MLIRQLYSERANTTANRISIKMDYPREAGLGQVNFVELIDVMEYPL